MKSNQLLFTSLGVLASVVFAANESQAQREPGGKRATVWTFLAERHDKNKDGMITQAEYNRSPETFARLDRTKDGVLSPADWNVSGGPSGDQRPRPANRGVAPNNGDPAPDFELTHVLDAAKTVKLSSFAGVKPVALIFGSCT